MIDVNGRNVATTRLGNGTQEEHRILVPVELREAHGAIGKEARVIHKANPAVISPDLAQRNVALRRDVVERLAK